jgi:tetrahydromethanopterin S-methyltransferase subunit G
MMTQWIQQGVNQSQRDGKTNVFDYIMDHIHTDFAVKPCTGIAEFKRRTTTAVGRNFEEFGALILPKLYPLHQIWLWKDVPEGVRANMQWTSADVGADAVIQELDGTLSLVQFKYRTRKVTHGRKNPNALTWKQLSTFYALAARSQGIKKLIVFTNCEFVRRKGQKDERDLTIAYTRLHNLPNTFWESLLPPRPGQSLDGRIVVGPNAPAAPVVAQPKLTMEQLRAARLKALIK